MRILIADDHAGVRKGVRLLLSSRSEWVVCAEAVDGLDAVEKAKSCRPDLVILDISMPKMSGLEAVPLIQKELPDSQVLILSQHDPAHAKALALRAGARGFVAKPDMARDLLAAIDGLAPRDGSKNGASSAAPPSPDTSAALPAGLEFLIGAGEMGKLIREFDWSKTPLGPIASWPQILKTSVGLILNSQHPMWIGWGPERTFLYNDAYISVLSLAKHPWALGRPAPEVWAEIWEVCGPLADKVFNRGEATFVDEVQLFMSRGDFVEETYYSFSYSPIRDESGRVRGLFCPSAEVTPKVLNARRLRTLSELTAKSLVERTTDAACASAFSTLSKNVDDIPFALLYLIDRDAKNAFLEQGCGVTDGGSSVSPGRIALEGSSPGALSQAIAEVATGGQSGSLPLGISRACQRVRTGNQFLRPWYCLLFHTNKKQWGCWLPESVRQGGWTRNTAHFLNWFPVRSRPVLRTRDLTKKSANVAESLAELDRAKTAFFSNVSHEFRTPLTLMLGPLDDLLSDAGNALPSEATESLKVVHRNSLRLLKLVNSLLRFFADRSGAHRGCLSADLHIRVDHRTGKCLPLGNGARWTGVCRRM